MGERQAVDLAACRQYTIPACIAGDRHRWPLTVAGRQSRLGDHARVHSRVFGNPEGFKGSRRERHDAGPGRDRVSGGRRTAPTGVDAFVGELPMTPERVLSLLR